MNYILILGAGLMQEPAIKTAKELGYKTIVFDGNNNAACKSIADIFEHIDLRDTDSIVSRALEIHRKKPLSAVFTAGTDFSYAVSCVANACNLPSHSVQASKNASDKILMRSCFEKAGVPSPNFMELTKATSKLEIHNFVSKVGYPVVIKPCDNMGARGCRLVRESDEIESAIEDAIFYSKTSRVIIEEYMEGPEFSIDALVYDSQVTITGFADRHIFYPPYFIEMGHSMPTDIDNNNYVELIKVFVQGIKALGLTHGAAKADIKLTKKGVMVGEIAARLSGGYMSGWTFPYASGLNLTSQALLVALNKTPELLYDGRKLLLDTESGFNGVYDYPCKKHCVERAWISLPGSIDSLTYNNNIENVKDIFPRLQKGDNAVFPVNNVQKAGNVICVGKSREEAASIAQKAIKDVFLDLSKNNEVTKSFLYDSLHTEFPPSAFVLPMKVYANVDEVINNDDIYNNNKIELPLFLKGYENEKDWNGITLKECVAIVNEKLKENKHLALRDKNAHVLHSLIRGSYQGALFHFL